MKTSMLSVGIALLAAAPLVYGGSMQDQVYDPCFSVNIQNDTVNQATVRQNCDHNINRTVQAGQQNRAHTIQTGQVNDNKVRQYQYDKSKYFRMREQ